MPVLMMQSMAHPCERWWTTDADTDRPPHLLASHSDIHIDHFKWCITVYRLSTQYSTTTMKRSQRVSIAQRFIVDAAARLRSRFRWGGFIVLYPAAIVAVPREPPSVCVCVCGGVWVKICAKTPQNIVFQRTLRAIDWWDQVQRTGISRDMSHFWCKTAILHRNRKLFFSLISPEIRHFAKIDLSINCVCLVVP